MPESNSSGDAFDQWEIVDGMGHQRYIGKVTEQVIAGQGFVRVDVPETLKTKQWTKLIGTSSIYAITPTTEEIARAMAEERQMEPISKYDLPEGFQPKLTSSLYESNADDDDFGEDEPSF